ncbi:serine/threonine-protein kinase [Streptosporangium amethystogenes]|uniref:serine/threonine-protein kinase n=1 Tax=Streptosporangium amethystogenes TaxID=2002 RepID=UPI001FE13824|nr:serine/threonine-protein kinase [Streptosporangium amethystogenes]
MIIDGRYELDALPLGQGGMGEVYGAYDQKLDRRVAVKLLRFPYGKPDDELVRRFLHEARIMAKLEHPGTPPIHDVGVFEDPKVGPRPFMVMQFVEGATVDHVLGEHGVLPVGWAVGITAQVAAVLCAAHERGVFHRDLKPSNLMVCLDGTVKVLDFGLAMFHDPELSRLTRTGTILGTPLYMSPEQVRGAAVTPQSDLYSLGLILHEMLTGERVFDGESEYHIFDRQVNEAAPSLRDYRSDVPAELDRLVLQLLAKRAEDRPARAETLHTALLSFVDEVGPLPGVTSPGPSPVRMYAEVVSRIIDPGDARPGSVRREPAGQVGSEEQSGAGEGDESFSREDLARARSEAETLAKASRYGQAVEVLDAVVAPAGRMAGPLDEEVLAARLRLGDVLFEGGDYRRAAPVFGELRVDLTRKHGPHDEGVLHCRRQEATCQALMGETGQALEMLRSLLVQEQAVYGRHDPRPLELRRQIGLLELGAGDTERARYTLSGLLEDLVRLHGPEHPDTVKVRDGLARLSM